MNKENLDLLMLCPSYYQSYEEGLCMENCTEKSLGQCPIDYVESLLEEKNQQITDLETKLAESEKMVGSSFKQNERLKYKLGLITSYNQELQKENDQLKQQLTEYQNDGVGDAILNAGKKIKELQQQLAEKDQAIEGLKEINQSLGQTCNNDAKEIEKLREQLEEKDIDLLKEKMAFEEGCQEYYSSGKYKKDFAIAELEKVKKIVLKEVERVEEIYTDGFQSGFNCCYVFMKKQINQQIKLLKGEK